MLARGRHHVEVEREHRDRREPRPALRVRHARHDPDALVRLGRRIVHHRGDEQPLAFVHRQAEQSRQLDGAGLVSRRAHALHDVAEQLAPVRGDDVDVVKDRLRHAPALRVRDLEPVAMQPAIDRHRADQRTELHDVLMRCPGGQVDGPVIDDQLAMLAVYLDGQRRRICGERRMAIGLGCLRRAHHDQEAEAEEHHHHRDRCQNTRSLHRSPIPSHARLRASVPGFITAGPPTRAWPGAARPSARRAPRDGGSCPR